MADRIVKCAFCGQGVYKSEAERYKNKNYHSACLQQQLDKEELVSYICKLFVMKAPGPRIYTQIKNFLAKYPNYTYKGIKQALEYFFEVLHRPIDKANQGIGIVPYVYDDAQGYFNNISNRQERIASALSDSLNVETKIVTVKKKKKEKNLYDIENL